MSSERKPASPIPAHEAEAFARCLLPFISAFFESEEGKAEYADYLRTMQQTSDPKP